MNLIKKVALAVTFAATALTSCEKKLVDLAPIDLIPSEVAIQNMNDVTTAVYGVYGTWSARRSHYISALMTDEVRLGTGSEYRNVGNALFNWQHVADSQDWRDTETGGVFTNMYQVIDRINRILEFMAPVVPKNGTETALKTQYRGELLALRAMAHLELLRHFSETPDYQPARLGVVLQTEYVKNPGSYQPSRSTQQQVITQIDADLAEARNLIPTTFTDNSRITRTVAIAFQVRSALWAKNWQGVVDRANEVLAIQGITTSQATYASIWTGRTVPATGTEVIWRYPINSAINLGAAIGSLWQDVNGAVQASPAVKLMNQYDQVNDIRFSTFFKTSPRNLISKYGYVVTGNGENFAYDIKLVRSSEILLARAEAYAELNQTTPANNDLSALRSARITGYTHTAITDKATLIAAIINERYKELCYEGQRYIDLKRRVLPIQRDIADAGGITTSQTLNPADAKYVLPIPQQERFANPNYQQNAGY